MIVQDIILEVIILTERPNFILVFPDQWRGDCLSSLGHPVVETPFLDHVAAEGMTFTSAYSAAPTCIPARACLATGQTPSTNGRLGYQDGITWNYDKTLMKCLRDGGYQTMNVGKTHFFPQRAALGFEENRLYEIPIHHSGFESDYHKWLEHESNNKVRDVAREADPNTWVVHPWIHDENLHNTTWITETAIELLWRRDPLRPFFLQIGYHRPHAPYDPPIRYYEMYEKKELSEVPVGDWCEEYSNPMKKTDSWQGCLPKHLLDKTRKAYYANMTYIDYEVGKLYNWLKKSKLLDNTYLIFLSDHGELLGDHNLLRKEKPFEGSAKIPLIVRPPKSVKFQKDSICDKPVTHMDVMPTLLAAAGISIPETVEGLSLLPLITGVENTWREFIHGEHSCGTVGWQYLTDGKEKYIWETASGKELFFDLTSDPQEKRDRSQSSQYKSRVNLWRNRLIEILASRPQDGLSDGEQLISGKVLPHVRPELVSISTK
jgi:arylsulfatase A-like enzyme